MSSSTQPEPLRRRRWQFMLLWLLGAVAAIAVGLWAFGVFIVLPLREVVVRDLADAVRKGDQPRIAAALQNARRLRADRRAAEDLLILIDDPDGSIRMRAADTLGGLGEDAVPSLVRAIESKTTADAAKDQDPILWARSARHPRAVSRLCAVLRDHAEGAVRKAIIATLATRCPPEDDEKLFAPFADVEGDVEAASGAAGKLGVFGPAATLVQESLCAALNDVDPTVRVAACNALSRFRPRDATVWDALMQVTTDEDRSVRVPAAYALAMIDRERATLVLPTAMAALSSADALDRTGAAYVISAVDPTRFPDAWPALKATLRDEDPSMRVSAVLAIQSFGANATLAVPELIRIVGNRKADLAVFGFAVRALTAIGVAANNTRVEEFYLAKIADADWGDRALWELIGFARKGSKPSLDALVAALRLNDDRFRRSAAACLGLVGPPAKVAIPALQEALKDDCEGVRSFAAEALEKIKPKDGAGQGNGASPP